MDDTKLMKFMHETDQEISDIISDTFNLTPAGGGNAGMSFHANLSNYNRDFKDSDYFYRNKPEFIHFTKLHGLTSIINERAIRFYDLNSSTDASEYKHAAKILEVDDNVIVNRSSRLYTFSFCESSEVNNPDMWRNYGDDFRGIGIIFEIVNDPLTWKHFHISNIKYEIPPSFHEYSKKIDALEKRKRITVDFDVSKLVAFYKHEKFKDEKEVRIMTYDPFDDYEELLKYIKLDYRVKDARRDENRLTFYVKLPLWVDNKSGYVKGYHEELSRISKLPSDYFDTRPMIRIKEIFIGANSGLSLQDYSRLRNEIIERIRHNYGYTIEMPPNPFVI